MEILTHFSKNYIYIHKDIVLHQIYTLTKTKTKNTYTKILIDLEAFTPINLFYVLYQYVYTNKPLLRTVVPLFQHRIFAPPPLILPSTPLLFIHPLKIHHLPLPVTSRFFSSLSFRVVKKCSFCLVEDGYYRGSGRRQEAGEGGRYEAGGGSKGTGGDGRG